MGDRTAQIISEWFAKCANVILQSRVVVESSGLATKERQNRWVRARSLLRLQIPFHVSSLFWDAHCFFQLSPLLDPPGRGTRGRVSTEVTLQPRTAPVAPLVATARSYPTRWRQRHLL